MKNVTTSAAVGATEPVRGIMTVFRVAAQIAKILHGHKRRLVEFSVYFRALGYDARDLST